MNFTYEEFINTRFGHGCVLNNIDTRILFEILTLVDASISFNNINTALTRLKKSLPFAAKLYPREIKTNLSEWLKCIESVEQHYTSDWLILSVSYTESVKRNAQNPLGSEQEKYPFYGALITEIGSNEDELVRAKIFGQFIAFKVLQKTINSNASNSNSRLTYAINSIRKAGDRHSIWFCLVSALVDIEFTNSRDYLEAQILLCHKIKQDSQYKKSHCTFINQVSVIAASLLQFASANIPYSKKPKSEIDSLPKVSITWTPSLPSENFDSDALAKDDRNTCINYAISLPNDADSEPLSMEGQQATIKSTQYDTEYSNQFLPWRWEALNPTEISKLSLYIADSYHSDSNDKKIAFIIALTLATGQDLQSIMNFKITRTLDSGLNNASANLIVIDELLWCHEIPHLKDRFSPNEKQHSFLEPVGNKVWLPLPKIIGNFINCFFEDNKSDCLISSLIVLEITQLKKQINDQFSTFRDTRKIRSTLSRCEKVLFDKIMLISSGDELVAMTIVGTSLHRPPAGLYYTSFEIDALQTIYTQATDQIFNLHSEYSC